LSIGTVSSAGALRCDSGISAAASEMLKATPLSVNLRDKLIVNQPNLTNYAYASRSGLRISSAPAQPGISHVINWRMSMLRPANGKARLQ
jgi:hypothetical protein